MFLAGAHLRSVSPNVVLHLLLGGRMTQTSWMWLWMSIAITRSVGFDRDFPISDGARLLVFCLPLTTFILVSVDLWRARRALGLFKSGVLAMGRAAPREKTSMEVHNEPVIRHTYAFETADGRKELVDAKMGAFTQMPEDAPLLYDPADPARAVVLAALPGAPRVDADGVLTAQDRSWTLFVLPLLVVVIHLAWTPKKIAWRKPVAERTSSPPARASARPSAEPQHSPSAVPAKEAPPPPKARGHITFLPRPEIPMTDVPAGKVRLRLTYDGKPFEPPAGALLTVFTLEAGTDLSRNLPVPQASSRLEFDGFRAARHHVSIRILSDATPPWRVRPGDWQGGVTLAMRADCGAEAEVPLSKAIHLLQPSDNSKPLRRAKGECGYDGVLHGPVTFEWEPLLPGASFRYEIIAVGCSSLKGPVVQEGWTEGTRFVASLPPSAEGELYLFTLEARRQDRRVGYLHTYGGELAIDGRIWHGTDYRFRQNP